MSLRLIEPTIDYENEALEFLNEFRIYNSEIYGCGGLDDYPKRLSRMA